METIIEECIKKGQTVIIEGIHLDTAFIKRTMKLYGDQCISFVIRTEDFDCFIKRSMVRGKDFSLNPDNNTYVKNYENIAEIKYHLMNQTNLYNETVN